jgi:hypothetical protein
MTRFMKKYFQAYKQTAGKFGLNFTLTQVMVFELANRVLNNRPQRTI